MDERLEKALDFSNYMVTLNNQKRLANEQYNQDLVHYYKGGQFTVSQQLISFCSTLLHNLSQDEVVLIDDNNTPIDVDSLEEFISTIVNVYSDASNRYHTEYNKIKTNRSVEGLVE